MAGVQEAIQESAASVATKAAVPVVLGGQLFFGYTLNELAAICGIVYTLIQTGFLIYDRIKRRKRKE